MFGIYCDCGDWGGTEDIEWRDGEDDDEKYVSGDCGWVENVEWWASEGVKEEYGNCMEGKDVEVAYVPVDCGGIG